MLSPDPTCLLALDTATDLVHLALITPERVQSRVVAGGAQASATTLPQLQDLLAQAQLGWSDVQAVAFGRGPGAFTGLRTACSVTQGLALGLEIPVIALDTLMAVAESARRQHPGLAAWLASDANAVLWVLQDARMSEVYAAAYRWQADQGWQCGVAPCLWSLPVLREQIESGAVHAAAGSALRAYPDEVASLRGPAVPEACPDGEALGALAQAAWRRGECLDAALALPLYVRDKVAQTTAERVAAREAST
ncbi:MAG TPA: tRNA (adenosine(37)-N6)-threonylcarbamoyltransferase complex dimerization subunit type 1 TsaB [Aquabacterium sp.]|uniref:tRNA (adenosine(37)-N6)-threonylcarbamoyltransferase complex dimerization subunit type 1 TsaB n=1 Tax=Aquabacterium sp. TaxID=1872578 RepID=UPI002E338706|nr:tRNA (adenosine(37)-N6)-threonylcarbamoyltransferase complex dimerization subunit type 1 TsaB [Aquabacterium sp.]HEX5374026.1 tRNA (adenosine(37)-N6)-threonylcarbamoyltransferase complex dimerization subunit type 1 TsaB [Aquabacterium sp.]